MPIENLLTPEFMRRICWNFGGTSVGESEISHELTQLGARPWQIQVTAPLLAQALLATEALEVPDSLESGGETGGEESSPSS
jgi:ribonuclease D